MRTIAPQVFCHRNSRVGTLAPLSGCALQVSEELTSRHLLPSLLLGGRGRIQTPWTPACLWGTWGNQASANQTVRSKQEVRLGSEDLSVASDPLRGVCIQTASVLIARDPSPRCLLKRLDSLERQPLAPSAVLIKQPEIFGTSLVVQWVRLRAPNAGGPGLIPGRGTRSRMPATTKTQSTQNK